MTALSKKVSQAVVSEMATALGDSKAAQAVGGTAARLKSLAAGRGQLSDVELRQISSTTGKTWRTWLLDMLERKNVSTQILSPTIALVNALNGAESRNTKTPKNSRRSRVTRAV